MLEKIFYAAIIAYIFGAAFHFRMINNRLIDIEDTDQKQTEAILLLLSLENLKRD